MIDIVPANTPDASVWRGVLTTQSGKLDMNLAKDSTTNSLSVIDFDMKEAHDGELYNIFVGTSVANGAALDLVVAQTGQRTPFARFGINTDAKTYFYLYEGTLFNGTSGAISGGAASIVNFNRNSSNVPSILALSGMTLNVSGLGTVLDSGVFIGTEPQKVIGSITRQTEWTLKTGTNYLMRAVNQAGTAKDMILNVQLYQA